MIIVTQSELLVSSECSQSILLDSLLSLYVHLQSHGLSW